ncbi:DUF4245 domain-containing protein [Actinopolyspora mortivallis]|uniref:DUF4245 domain-containing protein n=1 Tax=Actinopolyspora mortivallis TaxID=33906 RepID=UPI002159AE22|nr:DUF4245 domain-containing protein [Actinopolyspora mortivallis]
MRGVAEQRNQGAADEGSDRSTGAAPRSVRAMLFAMLPLVLVVLGIAGLTGRCSLSPVGPPVNDPETAPTVNVSVELDAAASDVGFPVVRPRPPEGWRANSADVARVTEQHRAVRVGWLTPRTHYLRLSQSAANEADLVAFETERPPRARGTVHAAGTRWVVYDSIRSEVAWVTDHDGVRMLITGNGTEQEFRVLAEAALRADPVRPE